MRIGKGYSVVLSVLFFVDFIFLFTLFVGLFLPLHSVNRVIVLVILFIVTGVYYNYTRGVSWDDDGNEVESPDDDLRDNKKLAVIWITIIIFVLIVSSLGIGILLM